MDVVIREVRDSDGKAVVDIFNRFARESFAVYSDKELGFDFFERNWDLSRLFYVAETGEGISLGERKPRQRR